MAAPGRVGLVVTCCAISFLYALYLGAISVLLAAIGKTFGQTASQQGRLFLTGFAGAVVGVLLGGMLSDRWGRKKVLLVSSAAYALGLTLFGVAPAFGLALLAAPLIGAGSSAMQAVANALASDLYPDRRALILNTTQISFGAGAVCSPLLAHTLLAAGTPWRHLYLGLAAAIGVLFGALCLQSIPRTPIGANALNVAALRSVGRNRTFVALCLAQICYAGAEVSFFSWMPTYFTQCVPGGAPMAGGIVSLFWAAMTVGRIAMVGLLRRIALLRLLRLLAGSGAVCAASALLGSAWLPTALSVTLTGLCFGGIFSLVLAIAGEQFPTSAGTVFGGITAGGNVGSAVLPWSVGALASTALGWRGALALVPAAALAVVGIAWRLESRR